MSTPEESQFIQSVVTPANDAMAGALSNVLKTIYERLKMEKDIEDLKKRVRGVSIDINRF